MKDYYVPSRLLGKNASAKSKKGIPLGWDTFVLHLMPAGKYGTVNVCPHASEGCAAACLEDSGRGAMERTKRARINKTNYYTSSPKEFRKQLASEIFRITHNYKYKKEKPAIRLNGTSGINWTPFIKEIQRELLDDTPMFYDYTKSVDRAIQNKHLREMHGLPYHLTFSKSEDNDMDVFKAVENAINVAVVFYPYIPDTWLGRPVIDGDKHDLRFLDPDGVIVGLSPKGKKAKQDTSGFVVRV